MLPRPGGLLLSIYIYVTLKMETVSSSETLVNFYETARRHIPEGRAVNRRSMKAQCGELM
jgi:hypothetical protein